jgi:hypothetical protein
LSAAFPEQVFDCGKLLSANVQISSEFGSVEVKASSVVEEKWRIIMGKRKEDERNGSSTHTWHVF